VKNNLDYLVEYKQGDTYEGGEYTPTTYDTQGNIVGARDMLKLYRDHYRRNIDSACILNETDKNFESLNRNFQINCYKDNLYFLPISFSRYHTVIVNGELVSPDRDIHDARLVVKL
jgi:hypothetical protein